MNFRRIVSAAALLSLVAVAAKAEGANAKATIWSKAAKTQQSTKSTAAFQNYFEASSQVGVDVFTPIEDEASQTIFTGFSPVSSTGTNSFRAAALDGGSPTPEPATMSLIGMGLVGLAGFRRRRKVS